MALKIWLVTSFKPRSKKRFTSSYVGFVSTFGWEKPETKAAQKYPNLDNILLHEKPKR